MDKVSESSIGVVLIPGAGLNSWIWDLLTREIHFPSLAVDLPGRGRHIAVSTKNLSLSDYVQTAASDIEEFCVEKIVIIAHSIGAVIGLELANRFKNRVAGMVVLSSAVPNVNESYASTMPFPMRMLMPLLLKLAGTLPPEAVIRKQLCQDLSEEDASRVVNSFIPESSKLYTDKLKHSELPEYRLYVRTTNDKTFGIKLQMRASLSFGKVMEISSGHLPMISHAKELSEIVNNFISAMVKII